MRQPFAIPGVPRLHNSLNGATSTSSQVLLFKKSLRHLFSTRELSSDRRLDRRYLKERSHRSERGRAVR